MTTETINNDRVERQSESENDLARQLAMIQAEWDDHERVRRASLANARREALFAAIGVTSSGSLAS